MSGQPNVDEERLALRARRRAQGVLPHGPHHEVTVDDGAARAVTIRLVPPPEPADAVVLYLHGGGWSLGGLDDFHAGAVALGAALRSIVVMVDYPLAPEHPFPQALESCWSALTWTCATYGPGSPLGLPVIAAGDSAGGNLAAVLSRRAAGSVDGSVLLYPITDCDLDLPSYTAPEPRGLTRQRMEWFWGNYVPAAEERRNPEASPLRIPDLRGMPPTFLAVAGHDVLRDEDLAYARRLIEAEVPTTVEYFPSEGHAFLTSDLRSAGASRLLAGLRGWSSSLVAAAGSRQQRPVVDEDESQ